MDREGVRAVDGNFVKIGRNQLLESFDSTQNGTDGFKRKPEQSQLGRYERVIGRQQMHIELLKKKRDSFGRTQGTS